MRDGIGEGARGRKTRIALDRRLEGGKGTGVASYARALDAAVRAGGVEPWALEDATLGRFGAPRGRVEQVRRWLEAWPPGARRLVERRDPPALWRRDLFRLAQVRFRLTGRVLRLRAPGPPGVAHWSYPVPAVVDGWINVHTIHDVIPLERPDLSPIDPSRLRRQLEGVVRATDRIATVSDRARRSIERALPEAKGRVVDLGCAVLGLDPGDATLPAGLEPGRFLLFCGLIEPRKNLDRIAAAWTAAGRPLPLVMAGPDGEEGPALRGRLAAAGVRMLSYQPRDALARLMADARALVFPSLAEGFGLPIAEAMSLGVPVVTGVGGATEEVAGGAALLVDALDETSIAGAIGRIAADDALAARLSAAGLRRAGAFSVEAFAARLAAFHDGLVAEGPRLA